MKALSINKTGDNNKQMKITVMLITLIAVLIGAVFVLQNKVLVQKKASGPPCVASAQCFFQPRPDWEKVERYTINLYEDGLISQSTTITNQEAKQLMNAEGYVVIDFPATHLGGLYKCEVTAINNCGNATGENTDTCKAAEPTPTEAPTSTPPPSPTITPTLSITPTPQVSTTPTVTPGGPTATPAPTITPGGPTLTPTPTPTDIIIVRATNTPTPIGSTGQTNPTITHVTQIPTVGFITPSMVILVIGIIAILIPLFI